MRGWVIAGLIVVAIAGILGWRWFKEPAVPATDPTKPSASVKPAEATAESATAP